MRTLDVQIIDFIRVSSDLNELANTVHLPSVDGLVGCPQRSLSADVVLQILADVEMNSSLTPGSPGTTTWPVRFPA